MNLVNIGSPIGHSVHVINFKTKTDLQTGEQTPMFQVRDSFSNQSIPYWIEATDFASHVTGIIKIDSLKSADEK
jgi:hypothetical protein